MSIEQGIGTGAAVVPLARPPIRTSVIVARERDAVFDSFVRTIDRWWPLRPFSAGGELVESVTFERMPGGRVYETWRDGTRREWGILLDWDPPERFVMTWNASGTPTEVELRFVRETRDRTRVELEHRGWENLTEAELGEDCALPGGYRGGSFHRGWEIILGCFVDAVQSSSTDLPPSSGESAEEARP